MLNLTDIVALAKQGYKPNDIKELIELTKEAPAGPEPDEQPKPDEKPAEDKPEERQVSGVRIRHHQHHEEGSY